MTAACQTRPRCGAATPVTSKIDVTARNNDLFRDGRVSFSGRDVNGENLHTFGRVGLTDVSSSDNYPKGGDNY